MKDLIHRHINTFNREDQIDKGRDNIRVHNIDCGGRKVEFVTCKIFDEAIQRFVETKVHWHQIVDYFERRQPLGLTPVEVTGVIWYRRDGDRGRQWTFAKSRSRWNEERGTWELMSIEAGAGALPTAVLKVEKEINP